MADKTASGTGKDTGTSGERIMNVPLRKEWLKAPRNDRGKRAMHALRQFVSRHTKTYEVRLSQKVNEKVWVRGIQKPPPRIRVKLSRDSGGIVHVLLPDETMKKPGKEEKKGRLDQVRETLEKDKGLPGMGGPKEEILKKGKKKAPKEGERPDEAKGPGTESGKKPEKDKEAVAPKETKGGSGGAPEESKEKDTQ